jgi:SAM-dependent methyltransferase
LTPELAAFTWPPPSPSVVCCEAAAGLAALPDGVISVVCCSPGYNLAASPSAQSHPRASRGSALDWRGYAGQDADAQDEAIYRQEQRAILTELGRVLAPGGSIFYVHTDRYWAGVLQSPISWLQDLPGLVLRQQIPWDQCGKTHQHNSAYFAQTHEYVFWLTHPGWRGRLPAWAHAGSVWRIPPTRSADHPAPFPLALARLCVEAGAPAPGGWVLDPFCGTGTTLRAALELGHKALGFDRVPRFCEIARRAVAAHRTLLPGLVEAGAY